MTPPKLFGRRIEAPKEEEPETESGIAVIGPDLPGSIKPEILDGRSELEQALIIGIANTTHDGIPHTSVNDFEENSSRIPFALAGVVPAANHIRRAALSFMFIWNRRAKGRP